MSKRIKQSQLWDIMQRTDAQGQQLPFQLKFVKANGEVREYESCTLTSFHSKGTTLNVLPLGEKRPRTINRITIIQFNNISVYL